MRGARAFSLMFHQEEQAGLHILLRIIALMISENPSCESRMRERGCTCKYGGNKPSRQQNDGFHMMVWRVVS